MSARHALVLMAILSVPTATVAQLSNPGAGAERKPCSLVFTGVKVGDVPTTHSESFRLPSGQYNSFIGGGVDATCENSDQRILADSAEHFGDEKRLLLIGRVHYTERRVRINADRMTYFTGEERILAEGSVVGTTSTGTRFAGPRATYFRVAPGIRLASRLEADSRPTIWVSPGDAGATSASDTATVQADLVISVGDSLIYAKGRVLIERPDLIATGDSAALDSGSEVARLFYSPKVVGRGKQAFTLEGAVIDAYSKQRRLQRAKSSGSAKATSDDVTLTADTIDLRLRDQKLDRAYAWGSRHAVAHSQDRDITADSIDIVMPNQVVREMRAVRNAIVESYPDSTKIVSKEKDWLRGDTIVAQFDSAASGDSAAGPAVRRITATGTAKSFFQVAPGGARKSGEPNVNYVTGRQITVDFHERQVRTVFVREKASGFYLEALPDTGAKRPPRDSTARAPAPTPSARGTKP